MIKPSLSELEARLDGVQVAADMAASLTLDAFKNAPVAENKGGGSMFDPVTATDRDAEQLIRSFIQKTFGADGIVGEEFADTQGSSGWTWCVDPIDGTRAFVAGVPVWSTLIGIFYDGEPVIGLIDHPAMAERYLGAKGKAWKQEPGGTSALKTRTCARLDDVILSCTEPMAMFDEAQLSAYEKIRQTARFSRLGLDAYSYALTASGSIDLVIEAQLKPYDIAALIPIIEGAGGKITDWQGGRAHDIGKEGGAVVCAGDPDLLDHVYPVLHG
ncbi:MAG: inositol monophosphatase family protein [Acidimicrobiales bacterium]|nr:inositol monophosphatase family protein [Hyphomonadaceae bacterium]RZV44862.1 MAG: inositol monophosphatase family protein [Acidimicrobiales bacterium]